MHNDGMRRATLALAKHNPRITGSREHNHALLTHYRPYPLNPRRFGGDPMYEHLILKIGKSTLTHTGPRLSADSSKCVATRLRLTMSFVYKTKLLPLEYKPQPFSLAAFSIICIHE